VKVARSIAVVGLVLALSGCVKLDARLVLDGDGVDGTVITALDKQVAAQSGQSQEELLQQMLGEVPAGATLEPFSDDRFIGTRMTLRDAKLSEVAGPGDRIRIVHADGRYVVTGELDLSQLPAGSNPDVRLSIDFPGRVLRHNGELTGTTVTWVGSAGRRVSVEATAEDAGSDHRAPLIALAIGVPLLLVLCGVLLWMVRRERPGPGSPPGDLSPAADRVLS